MGGYARVAEYLRLITEISVRFGNGTNFVYYRRAADSGGPFTLRMVAARRARIATPSSDVRVTRTET